jgi:Flp pilus assembly protein TadB
MISGRARRWHAALAGEQEYLMLRCGTCRSQMLEYLYDLLEASERQAWEEHLRDCASCQAELVRATAQKQLLARAAKMHFANVSFTPPAAGGAGALPVATLRMKTKPPRRWRQWFVAAAVLLAVALAGVGGWYGREYQRLEQIVAQAEKRIDQAQKDQQEINQQLLRLPEEQKQQQIAALDKIQNEAQLQVEVQGPAALRVGAPTDYQIFVRNPSTYQPTPAKVSVEIKDQGRTIARPLAVPSDRPGVYRLTLPADLPVRPESQPTLFVSARRDDGPEAELQEEIQLAAPVYITHLEIDKPMYQPGETVYFRSLTLDRFSLKPAEQDLELQFFLALPGPGNPQRLLAQGRTSLVEEGPNGLHPVLGPDGKPLRGVGCGSFQLDANGPGGEYALIVREAHRRFPEQRRKFLVNKYDKPKLNKELDFHRKSYGPGDEVVARCKAKYLDGRPLKNGRVLATVFIDNKQYGAHGEQKAETLVFQTDDEGAVNVRFSLPKAMERGLGTVTVQFDDRAMPDTLVRPIPIVLKKLEVEFCPEGGDLVAGLPNRVYFQVRNALGKPADLQGQLLEDGKPLGVTVATLTNDKAPELNQGMGRFEFTPKAGRKYELKVESPIGITQLYELPPIKPEGVVLSVPAGVVKAGEPIAATVRSTAKRSFLIGAYCRGRLLDSTEFTGTETHAVLRPASSLGGVCRITVFEVLPGDGTQRTLRPVAERLIYRHVVEQVQLRLKPDQKTYVPRQTVKLGVEATNERGEPTPAVVLLRVIDKSVVTLADDKTRRTLPTHFLLTTEVRRPEDLEYADFLLGPHPQAAEALDLLLGTQGWRRFAEQDPQKFRNEQKEEAERLLVALGHSQIKRTDLIQQKLQRMEREYARRTEELKAQAAQAQKTEQETRDDPAYRAALVQLKAYEDRLDRIQRVGKPLLEAVLIVAALVCLVLGLLRHLTRALPYYAATAVCVAMALLLARVSWWNVPQRHSVEEQMALLMKQKNQQHPLEERPQEEKRQKILAEALVDMAKGDVLQARIAAPLHPEAAPGRARPLAVGRADVAANRAAAEGKGGIVQQPLRRQMKQAEQDKFLGDRVAMPLDKGRKRIAAPLGPQPAEQPLVVREYKHVRADGPAEERYDFAETLYWHPVLVLPHGKTEVSFDLCDSLGAFEVTAFAHTLDGRLGSASQLLVSRLPFTVQPRTPLEVSAGDTIDVPLAVANNTHESRTARISLTEHANLARLEGAETIEMSAPAGTMLRKLYRFRPTIQEGVATLTFTGKADGFPADSVRTTFRILPEGFPVVGSSSDVLEKSATQELVLPETWIRGTLQCQVQVYPSTLADLQKGLEALLRDPNGCFEQSSSSTYPNVLVLQYLRESNQVKPEIERRAQELLDRGYHKLLSFECLDPAQRKKQGYEWFGGTAPPHEALTAYGLMEFRDMARVHEVDPAMLERTRQYLLHQRDGQGGFKRNPRALDTFGRAPQHITNAYIVWALTESGKDDDLTKELNALHEQAQTSKDPYFLALVANSLINRAKTAEAVVLLNKVCALQNADGHLDAEQTSITGSGGRDLQIETTSLALLAWLKANPGAFNVSIQKAIRWLGQQRGGYGGFGSTQSTILALKALILYTKANKKTPEAGQLHLFVGDKQVASLSFAADAADALTLSVPDPENTLKPGKNRLRIEITGKNVFPYTLTWSYQTRRPVSAGDCPVKLAAQLDRTHAREGETVHLHVHVANVSGKGQGMAVAILGLPGGLTLPEDLKQLQDYTRLPSDGQRPLVSAFEIRGRELVLYWRDLPPDQQIDVPIDLICRVPGEYSGPASRAYLYYHADLKHWVEPLKINITAKRE